MQDLMLGGRPVVEFLRPDSLTGALIYLCIFLLVAMLAARGLRLVVRTALTKQSHIDRTTISFLQQIGTALIWVLALIFYAQLIPQLRALGTALLAGASIASVVIGNEMATLRTGKALFVRGYYAQSVVFPAVPHRSGLIRVQINANHRPEAIDGLAAALAELALVAGDGSLRNAG